MMRRGKSQYARQHLRHPIVCRQTHESSSPAKAAQKGQFGSPLLNILIWLLILGIVAWLIMHYIVGSVNTLPGEEMLKP